MAAQARRASARAPESIAGPWSLPDGWRWERLGDVLPLSYGKALPSKERAIGGSVPVYGSSGIVGSHSTALIAGPVIIVGRKGSAGSIHLSEVACWPIDTAYFANPREDIDTRFAFHLLSFLRLDALDQSTAIPSLSRDNYSELLAPVPGKPEQRRIAARIDLLFEEIDDGERALAEARESLNTYRASLLNAAVTGKLTAEWRRDNPPTETAADLLRHILANRRKRWSADPSSRSKRYSEPAGPVLGGLPDLPENWSWFSIEQLSSPEFGAISDGPFGSNLKSEHYRDCGPRVIRLGNIGKEGEFIDLRSHIDQKHFASLNRHHVVGGDLVVAILGEPLPRAAVVPDVLGPALVKADCIKVRLLNRSHVPLVWCWLNSPVAHALASTSIKGVGRPRLSMDNIRSMPVPVPPPVELGILTQRLRSAMSSAENFRSQLISQNSKSEALRQSILSAAFRGELA